MLPFREPEAPTYLWSEGEVVIWARVSPIKTYGAVKAQRIQAQLARIQAQLARGVASETNGTGLGRMRKPSQVGQVLRNMGQQ